MLSNYALANWDKYLRVTPKAQLGKLPVAGAYDSSTGSHGFSRRVYVDDFERGGRLDFRGAMDEGSSGGDALAFVRHLAKKLSPESWAQMQRVLCEEQEEAGEDGLSDQPEYVEGLPKNGTAIAAEDALVATLGRVRNASGAPVLTSARAVTRELADLVGRIVTHA